MGPSPSSAAFISVAVLAGAVGAQCIAALATNAWLETGVAGHEATRFGPYEICVDDVCSPWDFSDINYDVCRLEGSALSSRITTIRATAALGAATALLITVGSIIAALGDAFFSKCCRTADDRGPINEPVSTTKSGQPAIRRVVAICCAAASVITVCAIAAAVGVTYDTFNNFLFCGQSACNLVVARGIATTGCWEQFGVSVSLLWCALFMAAVVCAALCYVAFTIATGGLSPLIDEVAASAEPHELGADVNRDAPVTHQRPLNQQQYPPVVPAATTAADVMVSPGGVPPSQLPAQAKQLPAAAAAAAGHVRGTGNVGCGNATPTRATGGAMTREISPAPPASPWRPQPSPRRAGGGVSYGPPAIATWRLWAPDFEYDPASGYHYSASANLFRSTEEPNLFFEVERGLWYDADTQEWLEIGPQ